MRASNIDFLRVYNAASKPEGIIKPKMRRVMAIILSVIISIIAVFAIHTYTGTIRLKSLLSEMDQESLTLNIPERAAASARVQGGIAEQSSQIKRLEELEVYEKSWGAANRALFLEVQNCCKNLGPSPQVLEWNYERDEYNLTITCGSKSPASAARLVLELKDTGFFRDVRYFGFEASKDGYMFDIICTLKAVSEG